MFGLVAIVRLVVMDVVEIGNVRVDAEFSKDYLKLLTCELLNAVLETICHLPQYSTRFLWYCRTKTPSAEFLPVEFIMLTSSPILVSKIVPVNVYYSDDKHYDVTLYYSEF